MDAFDRFTLLSTTENADAAEEVGATGSPVSPQASVSTTLPSCYSPSKKAHFPIHNAIMPNGKRIALLKTMQTSACERDCYYCAFRAGRDFRRITLKPEEMANAFLSMVRTGDVEGLFLSSGVAGGSIRTQDKLIATAEILRFKLNFKGYIHLKIMPGAEKAQVERAMQLANRVSVNLEAPNTERLGKLAPHKIFFEELLQPLQWVNEIRRNTPPSSAWNGRWPSTSTQYVVGGAGESDLELLSTTAYLHKQVGLARAYFSRFQPTPRTPLENLPPTNPWREHRLYQASFLLKEYGFDLEDLPFTSSGDLPLEADPKLLWARQNLVDSPIELNRADLPELLRIPGIGKRGAQAILNTRVKNPLHKVEDVYALGISLKRAFPFITIDGHKPPVQLTLW